MIILLLAQTTYHDVFGVGLHASVCKIPHSGQCFKSLLIREIGLYASIYGSIDMVQA